MRYISTRSQDEPRCFLDVLLSGLAPDGGLYVPEQIPTVSYSQLTKWRGRNYRELCFSILSLYIDDIPEDDLRHLIDKTYSTQVFFHGRRAEEAEQITPVMPVKPNLYLQELSNGPTLAFKDMAMQLLGHLFAYALAQKGQIVNILGATSGDTGSAAEYAVRGKERIRIFMLSPYGRMSAFQRAQMYSLADENVINIAVRGDFDACQAIVKTISADAAFKEAHHIGAVNSINWARIVAQTVYYFKAYFAVTQEEGQPVDFSVPTGNFGNIYAGYLARRMGLPIRRLLLATNENDVLHEFFRTGIYAPRDTTQITSSPSMDISRASNFERFIYDLVGDCKTVKALWSALARQGCFDLGTQPCYGQLAKCGIVSGKSTHSERMALIRKLWREEGLLVDPHTADALNVAQQWYDADCPTVILETAQPAKFSESIYEAIGLVPPCPPDFQDMERRAQHVTLLDADVQQVKEIIRRQCN